jgi:uncharacterized protein (DUF1499 family)
MHMIPCLLLAGLLLVVAGCARSQTSEEMLARGELLPCPDQPNCVNSQAPKDSKRYIEPIAYDGELPAAMDRLAEAVGETPRTQVVERREGYLRAKYTSLLGFIDDMEFLADDERKVFDVRSSSRIGYYDFHKNREHVEAVRKLFHR